MRLGSSSALAWVFRFHPTEIERKVSTEICALLKPGPAAGTSPVAGTGSGDGEAATRVSAESRVARRDRLTAAPSVGDYGNGPHVLACIWCSLFCADRMEVSNTGVHLCTLRNVKFFWEFLANSSNSTHLRRVPRAIGV